MKNFAFIIGILLVLAAFAAGFWLVLKEDPIEEPSIDKALTVAPFTGEEAVPPTNRRTVMAVINNHPDARPQTGLAQAGIVFEMIAEYDVTRFVALYQSDFPDMLGPSAVQESILSSLLLLTMLSLWLMATAQMHA